jgi:hypothetical protein
MPREQRRAGRKKQGLGEQREGGERWTSAAQARRSKRKWREYSEEKAGKVKEMLGRQMERGEIWGSAGARNDDGQEQRCTCVWCHSTITSVAFRVHECRRCLKLHVAGVSGRMCSYPCLILSVCTRVHCRSAYMSR